MRVATVNCSLESIVKPLENSLIGFLGKMDEMDELDMIAFMSSKSAIKI